MPKKITVLPPEQKLWAVQEYLSGKGSTYSVAKKYSVSDTSIRRWLKQYKRKGELAFQKSSPPSQISPEEKCCAVHDYLEGNVPLREIAYNYGVTDTCVRQWILKHHAEGNGAFVPNHRKTYYSKELKQQVIQAYLEGEGSYGQLCQRFQIPSISTVNRWIMQYNSGRSIEDSETGGSAIMKQGRKTTYAERVESVSFCIENQKDYQLTTETYGVSYQQIYSWVKKYESRGAEALTDQRGRTKPETEMTEAEKLFAENRLLKAQNKRQEMEITFLKKLDEIERRRF